MDQSEIWKLARRGTLWSLGGQGAGFLVVLAGEVVRGRLLRPAEIGAFVMALAVVGLVEYLSELGLGSEIVRRPELSNARTSAVHRTIQVASVGFALAGSLAAPLLGQWYGDPEVVGLAAVSAWAFVLHAPGAVPRALLVRELSFRVLVRVDLISSLLNVVIVGVAAAYGAGAWALVWGMMGGIAARSVQLRRAHPWRPEPPDWSEMRPLLLDGGRITASRGLFFVQETVDRILFGRYGGTSAVGLYTRGTSLALLPSGRIAAAFNQVAYAGFAALQNDVNALRRHYLATLRMISLVVLPVSLGLAAVAPEAILAIYGPQWMAATPVLQAAALAGATRSLRVVAPALFIARGQAGLNVRISLAQVLLYVLAFSVGARHGLEGMALVWIIALVPLDLLVLGLANREVGVRAKEVLAVVVWPLVRSTAMAVVVLGMARLLPDVGHGMSEAAWAATRLGGCIVSGMAVYVPWTLYREPGLRQQLADLLRHP